MLRKLGPCVSAAWVREGRLAFGQSFHAHYPELAAPAHCFSLILGLCMFPSRSARLHGSELVTGA